jgi:hypothetical protein
MSWSMIEFGDSWADAHDSEQILFMSLAPEFLDSSPKFKHVSWLQEWKAYWLKHKETHVNGCSDIDLPRFLSSEDRVCQFRDFLAAYKTWLRTFGDSIPADVINAKTAVPFFLSFTGPCEVRELIAFACTIEDLLSGSMENKRVHKKPGAGA